MALLQPATTTTIAPLSPACGRRIHILAPRSTTRATAGALRFSSPGTREMSGQRRGRHNDGARKLPRLRRSSAPADDDGYWGTAWTGADDRTPTEDLVRAGDPDAWWNWRPEELRPEDLVEPTGRGAEEVAAIRDAMVREPLRPVWLALQEIAATRGNVFRCRGYHVAVLSGPLLLAAGLCKLRTVAPNLFMDIVLGYMFYKLSVLAANLERNGKANIICGRMQLVLMLILGLKRNNPTRDFYYHFTESIWTIAGEVYIFKVYCDCVGIKLRHVLEGLFKQMLTVFKGTLATIGDLIMG